MRRSAAGLTAAWLLSCAPVALPGLWEPTEASLGDASRAALAAIPWLAWIGVPRTPRGEDSVRGSGAGALGTAAFSLPPLAAAAAIDLGHGRSVASVLCSALASLAMILLLAFAAGRAALGERGRAFAWAWIVLVPGLPILRCALEAGGAPAWGSAPNLLARLSDASPIAWAWARAGAVDGPGAGRIPWAGLAVCVALLAIAGSPRARPADGPAPERAP